MYYSHNVLCYSEVFIKKHWVNSLFYLMLQQFTALVSFGMGNNNWVVVVCVHMCASL